MNEGGQNEPTAIEKPKTRTKRGNIPHALIDERIATMLSILASRPTIQRCQLHKELCPKWNVHWRTVDNYLVRARKLALDRLHRPRDVFRAESLAFFESKMHDPKATVGEQLRARQLVGELLGLNAPVKVDAQVSGGIVVAQCPFNPADVIGPPAKAIIDSVATKELKESNE